MDGKPKLPPSRNDEPKVDKISIYEGEQVLVPNPLASRLNQIKTTSHLRTEKINQMLGILSPPKDSQEVVEPISASTVLSQIDDLTYTDLSPIEFIKRSHELLRLAEQARIQVRSEYEQSSHAFRYSYNALYEIESKLGRLASLN